jgi:hypothetical protein
LPTIVTETKWWARRDLDKNSFESRTRVFQI